MRTNIITCQCITCDDGVSNCNFTTSPLTTHQHRDNENVHPDSTMKATTTVTPRQVDIYSFQMFYLLQATTSQVRCHCHHYRDH